jgi:excisionase family DNA binding protein
MTVPNRPAQGHALTYTPQELRGLLQLGRDRVYTLIHSGEIRSIRIGQRFLVPNDAVTEFLKGQK